MIKIGIVGDIGSGKSFVAKQFLCPIFNADKEVNKIYNKDKKCFYKLRKSLPDYVFSFPIKKKEIKNAILKEKKNIRKIEKIVHPIVRKNLNFFLHKNKNKKIVVLDIPLLIENKINKKNYILIFIDAKKKEIIKNLKKRRNYSPEFFKLLKKFQLPLEKKKRKSDYIIKNNFKSNFVKKSVKFIKKEILEK